VTYRVASGFVSLMLIVSGCASHTWAPGPGMSAADFEPAKAQCSLMARHGGGGFAAYGDANFVAGATVGNAIGETVRTQRDFNDCMAASGWKIADQSGAASQVNQSSAASQATQSAARQAAAERAKTIVADMKSCVAAIRANPIYEPLLPHFADLATSQYTMAQLTDERRPTPVEGHLIVSYHDATNACRVKFTNEVSAVSATWGAAISQELSKVEDVDVQLAKRQLTWGDAATQVKQIAEAAKAQLRATRN
jgi:hypothetical protein